MTGLAPETPSRVRRLRGPAGWTLITTSIGFVIVQLDITIANVALPQIAAEFSVGMSELQWIIDAYSLGFATLLLTAGVAGDRFGSRRIFVTGLALFGCTSLGCGLASSAAMLIAARALQGVGAALILPTSLALIAHASEDDERARIGLIGWWSASGALAVAAGPVVGGFLISWLGWRPIFLLNLPLCSLGLFWTWTKVRETSRKAEGRFDIVGLLLAAVCLFILTGTVIQAGRLGWSEPFVLAGFGLAIVLGIAFFRFEATVCAPMLHFGLFRVPGFSSAAYVGTVISLTFFGLVFVLSLYFQEVRGYSPATAGLAFMPLTAVIMFANLAGGKVGARVGFHAPMIVGMTTAAAGNIVLLAEGLGPATSFPILAIGLCLISIGTGVAAPAMMSAALAKIERTRSGTASGVLTTARQVGGAIGIALFGSLVAGGPENIQIGSTAIFLSSAILLLIGAVVTWLGV
ncbi:MFS transporter [Bosea sp. UNC402CLCol]|uniref:MFS transporter n=1 Tax=Bosea sp. UNC402CLCol TaxID=1510531 RepID=UPI00056DCB49|nr:MFS transporter [Bosea sp. UNC402CLCol]